MKSAWFLQLARLRLARLVLTAALVVGALVAGTVPASAAPDRQVIRFPLHTEGHLIVDSAGQPVHLAASNWYGAESTDFVVGGLQAQPLEVIVRQVRELGFNAVRLQWSNQMLESDPVVPDYAVAANPDLRGRHAMDVFDRVVHALSDEGIMVILDNH